MKYDRSQRKIGKKRRRTDEKGALDLANEAINLLRSASPDVIASYYIGAVPFVVALLFFWSDMSRSAYAQQRCLPASLGLVALFIWMKCWQVIYLRGLRTIVNGCARKSLTLRQILRMVGAQVMTQPYGLLSIPVALAIGLPFHCVYGYYQNVSALGDGTHANLKELSARAWRQARLWPRQNHILLWLFCPWVLGVGMLFVFGLTRFMLANTPDTPELSGLIWFLFALILMYYFILPLSPFGCIVAGNIAVAVAIIPHVLHSLLGIDSVFTLSGWHGIFNTTFLMTVFGLSFLCLDPLIKAVFALRCFYGEAQQSGEDLRIELRECRAAADSEQEGLGAQ